jgi:cell shape-determining protein MreD
MIKYLYYIILSLFLVLIAYSLLPVSGSLSNLNIILVFLVITTIIFGFNQGFIFAVIIGFLMNYYSFFPFGTFILIFLLIIWLVDFLYKHVLINFSIYSNIILIIVSTLLYSFFIILFNYIFYLLGLIKFYILLDKIFLSSLFWQLGLNMLLMIILFFLAKITIKRLNIVFLLKK